MGGMLLPILTNAYVLIAQYGPHHRHFKWLHLFDLIVLAVASAMLAASLARRNALRFSLRNLLIATTLLAMALGFMAYTATK